MDPKPPWGPAAAVGSHTLVVAQVRAARNRRPCLWSVEPGPAEAHNRGPMARLALLALFLAAAAATLLWALLPSGVQDRGGAVGPALGLGDGDGQGPTPLPRSPRPVGPNAPAGPHGSGEGREISITLAGRLVGSDGVPLDAEQVELRLAGPGGTQQARVERGFFEVRGLLPGRFDVDIVAFGYRSLRASLELSGASGFVNRDFQLETARWVHAVARSADGRELGEALAALGLSTQRSAPRFVLSSRELPPAGGSLKDADPPPAGRLHPELLLNEERGAEQPPGAVSPSFAAQIELFPQAAEPGARVWIALALGTLVLDVREILPQDESVALSLDPRLLGDRLGAVSLRVLDGASETPLPHVNAWVGTGDTTSLGQSDGEGRIRVDGILPGRVMVYLVAAEAEGSLARRAGYADDVHWADLEPGEELELGDVRLFAPVKLALSLEAEGRPAPPCNLEVALLRTVGGTRLFDPFLARSEVGPEVELELPARELVVVASSHAAGLRSRPSTVDLSKGGDRRGRLVLERATRVELVASSPAAPNWSYLVLDESGVQSAAGRFDARGSAHFALLPGAYWLSVEDSYGFERANLRCDVGQVPLRLRL